MNNSFFFKSFCVTLIKNLYIFLYFVDILFIRNMESIRFELSMNNDFV